MLDGLRRRLAGAERFDAMLARWRLSSAQALAKFVAELLEAPEGAPPAAEAPPNR